MGDAPENDKASTWRLAVHVPGQAEPFCLVWQDAAEEVRAAPTNAADIAAVVDALKPVVVESFRDRMRWETDGGVMAAPWTARAACYSALELAGFEVRPIPTGDLEMRVTIDLSSTGPRVVGESLALQGKLDEGLAGDLFRRLRAMPESMTSELAAVVAEAVGRGDSEGAAAEALEKAPSIMLLGNSPKLLSTLRLIDASKLSRESRLDILRLRFGAAGALRDFGAETVFEARTLRDESGSELDEGLRLSILLAEGCAAADAGQFETAFAIWRSILTLPAPTPSARAWAYNNLASLLKTADPDAAKYSQLASDAFLQCRDRVNAARNVLRFANCILAAKPVDALKHIDEAIGWFAPDDANSRDLRAGLLHVKANTLSRLGHPAQAEGLALQAAELRRDIHGAEGGRCASLHLASIAAKEAGHLEAAAKYREEAEALAERSEDAAGKLQRQVASLVNKFDGEIADRLDAEAAKQGNARARMGIELARSLRSGATHAERIAHLEKAQGLEDAAGGRAKDMDLVHHALGSELLAAGFPDRALPHYLAVLEHNPLNYEARQNAAALLWKLRKWDEAATFFANQLRVFGRKPDLLYSYGRSLLESGDPHRAAGLLDEARTAEGADPQVRKYADHYLSIALKQGGRPTPPPGPRERRPVDRAELEQCLGDFTQFVRSDKRMALWQSATNGGHKWKHRPEGIAKDLLHTFLKSRFGPRVEGFEEVATGAGRIDLYLRCEGGLVVVLELKMVGDPYTATYGFSGEGQVLHYMENKSTGVGYLLLFDARKQDFGVGPAKPLNASTVRILFVDVRPDAPSSVRRAPARKRGQKRGGRKTAKKASKPAGR